MNVYLTKRWGKTIANPHENDLVNALEELKPPDPEHPDCWLADENGWTISAFQSGRVILENAETGEGPWHLRGIRQTDIMRLWSLLASGKLDEIKQFHWVTGYS
jgi:hypothetical protein